MVTLNEADIAAYGASSLGDLISALGPQTGSGRGRGGGRPLVLLNGQRISNFREMRGISPEAVRRMEVLPEEVALRYGFPPNQRVVNFILKQNFSSRTLDGEYNIPTRGGFATSEAMASLLTISGASRFNLNIFAEDTSLLTEGERGVIQPDPGSPVVPGDPDPAQFRSLIADSRDLGVNGSWSKGLGEDGLGGSLSLNASYARNDTRSLSGLDSVLLPLVDPLTRTSLTHRWEGGGAFNRPLGNWQLSLTLDGGHVTTTSLIDRRAIPAMAPITVPAGVDRARVVNDSANSLLTLTGRAFRMPAGDVTATVKAGFAWTGLTSSDTRQNLGTVKLKRGDTSAGVNIGLPIASRRDEVLAGLGDLSLNFSAGLNRLSDFGTLTDWSAGLTWEPFEKLTLGASYLVNEAAPSLGDLGNPFIETLNVPVFDFATGQTALVTIRSGGNPDLRREKQRDLKFSANWELPFLRNSSLIAEYFRNRSDDVTAAFPVLTPEIEAAFPDRVERDPVTGQLTAIDRRPVTFGETSSSRLRYGINISGSIGKPPPGREGGEAGEGSRRGGRDGGFGGPGGPPQVAGGPGRGPGRGGGGGGGLMRMLGGGGGGGQGRWNLALYHTVRFDEQVVVAPGGPVLDLLGGDALSGGGVSRHALELDGGAFHKGFGLRLNGSWSAPTRITGTSNLRFGSVLRLDLRLFSDLGQHKRLTDMSPIFKGMRLAFQFDNILNSRQKVTDANGVVPLSYQPDYLDPRSRMIGIDLRKVF